MDKEILDNYKKAGKIAGEVLQFGRKLIKPGASMLEVLKKIEARIISLGAGMAFPPQISCNEVAAHYYPEHDDTTALSNELASLDIGVHINGYIGDTALTVDLSGEYTELVRASREALDNAIKLVQPEVQLCEIGRAIEETITGYGFVPVRNLSGHGLGEFNVHTGPSVPNYDNADKTELEDSQIIAIEPFASMGEGMVYEKGSSTLYMLAQKKPVRNMFARQILAEIDTYNGLPFADRWLIDKLSAPKVKLGFRELLNLKMLRSFPPLVDGSGGFVSQAEHTVLVRDKPVVLTKADN